MSRMSEVDIEVRNICPGTPERPMKGTELTFQNLQGKWYEQAKLDGDRVILAHGVAFNRHGQLYQRDYEKKLGDIYDELKYLFNEKVFDIEYLPTGPNAGKCALLDIPNMISNAHIPEFGHPTAARRFDTPYEMRHLIIKSTLPCQPGHEWELKYDICALPSIECTHKTGELYRDLKHLYDNEDSYKFYKECPFEGVVLKSSAHTYRWDRKETTDWIKVRFK